MPEYNSDMPGRIVDLAPRDIKTMARQTLAGKWLAAFAVALVMEAILSLPSVICSFFKLGRFATSLLDVYSIVLTGPATFGLVKYYTKVFRMQEAGFGTVLSPFRDPADFLRGLMLYVTMLLRIILWSFVLIIPGIVAAYRFSMAFRIQFDHPEYSTPQCLAESSQMMQGNKLRLFNLQLSFFGWLLIVGLPRSFAEQQLAGGDLTVFTDADKFGALVNELSHHPFSILSSVLAVLVSVYMEVSTSCFYDILNGNLMISPETIGVINEQPDTPL